MRLTRLWLVGTGVSQPGLHSHAHSREHPGSPIARPGLLAGLLTRGLPHVRILFVSLSRL